MQAQAQKAAPEVVPPQLIEKADPEYTKEARNARIEGSVIVSGTVALNGRVTGIVLVRPLPYGLGDQAIECVRKWRFKPATKDGVPFESKHTFKVDFFLHGK
jgi:TonB family protein